ncbi:hypothetical protein ACU4GR_04765 [Methylobacterium oryzae CBMB20]
MSPLIQEATASTLALLNGFKGRPDSFGPLHRLLEAQAYRLAHWRVASSDINYRRFFDVNSLAGLRVELSDIFHRSHETVFRHVREGRIDGLRIDHIDGLADPLGYARALQAAVGPGFYVVVEKILEPGERLRPWPVAGTTGYDVLNQLDGILVDKARRGKVERLYTWATGFDEPYGFQLRAAKAEILEISFASELEVLTTDLEGGRRCRPAHPRLHRQRTAPGADRDHRALPDLPQLPAAGAGGGRGRARGRPPDRGRGRQGQALVEPAGPLGPRLRRRRPARARSRRPGRAGRTRGWPCASAAGSSSSPARSWPRAWRTRCSTATPACWASTRSAAIRASTASTPSTSTTCRSPAPGTGRAP